MTFVIGLTGGIASGKTTVANLFNEHFDIDIVDADVVAREVVEMGTPGLAAIVDKFGQQILDEQGSLNRSALREVIFSSPEDKEWLNGLLHPMIRQLMIKQLEDTSSPYALLVVPLMVENSLQSLVNRLLVVDVEKETQIERTMARDDVSRSQVESILSSQASRQDRLACADDVIKNNTENEKLLPQITELHKKYLAMSSENL
ncbi:dephospho-CoA kinase [Vibrio mexicanus]|uniref:dephospho-CoA kinase n=1 Tax=Vibrio mexicanus TaxID=1004326 RepID=UPI00063CCB4A|nr:dephospho-CoA kinase [Vibrio mexicanus]